MCSPYAFDRNSSSIYFSMAESEVSLISSFIFSTVGGNPVRSRLNLRISVSLSALAVGFNPSCFNRARTNRSISLCTHRLPPTLGGVGSAIGWNAQCISNFAPSLIHSAINSFCLTLNCSFESTGGICCSGSDVVIRCNNSL